MNNTGQAIWVEALKVRRAKILPLSLLGFMLFPLVGGLFMIILKDPAVARQMGLISTKARLAAGTADWPAYLTLLAEATAGGGLMLFSLIGSWVFGREYVDRTIKDLLALPTSRSAIVLAKFVVLAGWWAALTTLVCGLGLAIGLAVGLPPVPASVILNGGLAVIVTALLSMAVVTPVIFFASAGQGYLPPMGVALLVLFLAQVIGALGWGEYFPWSIPLLYSQGTQIGPVSLVIVVLTGAAGMAATFAWWKFADQVR